MRFRVQGLGVYGFQGFVELFGGSVQGDFELCIDHATAGLHMVFMVFLRIPWLRTVLLRSVTSTCGRGVSVVLMWPVF